MTGILLSKDTLYYSIIFGISMWSERIHSSISTTLKPPCISSSFYSCYSFLKTTKTNSRQFSSIQMLVWKIMKSGLIPQTEIIKFWIWARYIRSRLPGFPFFHKSFRFFSLHLHFLICTSLKAKVNLKTPTLPIYLLKSNIEWNPLAQTIVAFSSCSAGWSRSFGNSILARCEPCVC